MKSAQPIGEYLIRQLHAHGVRHVFGIPGDYVLGFHEQMQDGPSNDVATWHYARLPEILGAGQGFVVRTEEELDEDPAGAMYQGPPAKRRAYSAAARLRHARAQ